MNTPHRPSIAKRFMAAVKSRYFRLREKLSPSRIRNAGDIPVIINNFNRLTTLRSLITSLEERGLHNIHILDNDSTYPPLLEWYRTCPYEVIHLGRNLGFKALWKDKATRRRFCRDYYTYTDSDVVLDDDCPADVMERLYRLLKDRYPYAAKIGLSLRIDNLPEHYAHKQKVLEWESRYYTHPTGTGLYRAPVDTTFALYRPRVGLSRSRAVEAYRTAVPYRLKHLPWYTDSQHPSDEERYYTDHCRHATEWSSRPQSKK